MEMRWIFLFAVIFALPVVSAEIFIAQMQGLYNVGDEINSEITLIPNENTVDHFKVDMICGPVSTNIYNQYFNLAQGYQQTVNANTQLIGDYFTLITYLNVTNYTSSTTTLENNVSQNSSSSGNFTGLYQNITIEQATEFENCYLDVSYGNEFALSNHFEVSRNINVDVELDLERYDPNGVVNIVGEAEKDSGFMANGFIEVFVDSLGIYLSDTITNGVVDLSFTVPDNAKSGEHNLTIKVYEINSLGEETNIGYYTGTFVVNQDLRDLEILLSSTSTVPGEEFSYTVNTYDQADDIISQDISVTLYKPQDIVFTKKLVKADSVQTITFDLNNTPGYWKIEASVGDLIKRKLFYLEELSEIQTSLVNDTLIITNIGNVLFEGPLEITIGSTVEVKHLKIKIGETQKFKLRAPEGDYTISVNDGSGSSELGTAFLTGNAIRVIDSRAGFLETLGNPLVWWLIVIIVVIFVVIIYLKKYLSGKKKKTESLGKVNSNNNNPVSGIVNGTKEHAYVIAVKSKSEKDSEYLKSSVEKALHLAKETGAKVYVDGDYKIIVMSPRLTKKLHNEITAVTIAKRIEGILSDHNKQYKDKIVYGIGVNDGEIISELSGGHFRFTTTGNLISNAKRIANEYKMKVLLSESVHRRLGGSVKTKKSKEGYWEVVKIHDRSKHKDFLKRFKK